MVWHLRFWVKFTVHYTFAKANCVLWNLVCTVESRFKKDFGSWIEIVLISNTTKPLKSYYSILQTKSESGDCKLKFDWLNFINKDPKFWGLMGSKVISWYDWPIKPQNLCLWLVKSSQSNFNLRSPDCYWVCSYLITTVNQQESNQINLKKK